ncbi:hypothetical protein BDZ90DRAFT_128984 [Jaminaea rosea]|uniref:Uncharacterized protein n=1 Tax=Jaminaea rosea TaxID=1569628 RepID=A0A316UVA3_9BASI|nr:hypothetical protein BDZ90DRAFT_128984 [Jaminaea rosea]PWN28718.1 hypothetical protein BDZ90DRAFT_128984 [Jaminaea rosea]
MLIVRAGRHRRAASATPLLPRSRCAAQPPLHPRRRPQSLTSEERTYVYAEADVCFSWRTYIESRLVSSQPQSSPPAPHPPALLSILLFLFSRILITISLVTTTHLRLLSVWSLAECLSRLSSATAATQPDSGFHATPRLVRCSDPASVSVAARSAWLTH